MKKNLLHIIVANIFYMIIVAGTNFILPKFTSLETYAAVKEYTLYITTYANILTLGYINGVYLEYGGKDVDKISPSELGKNIFSFFVFLLPVCILISAVGIISNNFIVTVVGAGIMSTNLVSYYQLLYQATGDFKSYGIALNASRVLTFAVYVLFIFVFRTDNRILYVSVSPAIGISIAIYLTIKINKRVPVLKNLGFDIFTVKRSIRGGFILMLGDFVTKFFSTIDRWFVKVLMETFSFAMYSFAVSMENLVNTFMTPVTVSMYNYFCKKPPISGIRKMKNNALIYSLIVIAGAYPAKWILEMFMNEYISANDIIFLLFAAQGIGTIIKGIYVNKYKADGTQKKYLFQMIVMLILAVILNAIFYVIWKSMIAIAVATFVTNLVWLIWCEYENEILRFDLKAVFSFGILIAVFLFTGYRFNSIIGCAIYCTVGILLGFTLMRESFVPLCKSLMQSAMQKINHH